MSFFDEADDEPRRPSRGGGSPPRARRPTGGGGRRHDQQAIQTRRTVAVVVLVVVVVLLALGIHSCDVSQRNSALRDYTNSVSSIIGASDATGQKVFGALENNGGANSAQNLQGKLTSLLMPGPGTAQYELQQARSLSVPSQMQTAQQNLVLALRMRRDGLRAIAEQIQPALGTTTNKDAIDAIAAAMAQFYASDVVYKNYAAPAIAGALNSAGIPVGGTNGETINAGQFVSELGWLEPTIIAAKLGVHLPGTPAQPPPALTQVAVGTNTMVPGVTNHVKASPPPTFTITLANTTHATLYGINCSVALSGLTDTGHSTLSQLDPGQTGSCTVTLPSSPNPGTFNVTARVSAGAGSKGNTLTFPVQFL